MTTDVVIRRALHAAAAEAARLGAGGKPRAGHAGLCWHASTVTTAGSPVGEIVKTALHLAFEAWPEFSGRSSYPVPHPLYGPGEAYLWHTLWGTSEYANTRRRLCRHVAEYIERMIDNMYWEA